MFTACPDMLNIKYSEHEKSTLFPAEKVNWRGTAAFIAPSMSSEYFQSQLGKYKASPDNTVGQV